MNIRAKGSNHIPENEPYQIMRLVGEINVVIRSAGQGNNNDSAGEGQQQCT
jgi:hypothetical protein